MSSHVFYRKWRPQTFAEVAGQEMVTQTLRNALSSGRVSHAYLFCGPRGTGKTSTGRILAKAVNCLTDGKGEPCNTCALCQAVTEGKALDVIEIDAASNRGIDDIRELRERVNYVPNQARYKVYIIDEVHMLSQPAANALLKTLEEPPAHVIFVLATTEVHKILPTIMSRCQRFDFKRLSRADVVAKLTQICQAEGISIEPDGLRLIARSATGSLRDAENLLEQLTTYFGAKVELHQVQAILGVTGDARVKELVRHIAGNDVAAGMKTITSLNADGLDLKQFNRELVEYLRALLLLKTGSSEGLDLTADDLTELKELAAKASLPQVLRAVKVFGQLELGMDSYSTLPLELALVDYILPSVTEKESPISEAQPAATASTVAPAPPKPPVARPKAVAQPAATTTSAKTKPVSPPTAATATPAQPKPPAVKPQPVPAEAQPVAKAAAPSSTPAPPAPTPPQPAAGEPAIAPELGTELERLMKNWKQIVEKAPAGIGKVNSQAIALLRSAVPTSIEDDNVVLAFKYSFHKEHLEKADNQKVAADIISNFLGRPCHVRCVHQPENNPLVKAALRMGAQITSVEEK
jgi:DNA polymerase-3 subunit gamma/tau